MAKRYYFMGGRRVEAKIVLNSMKKYMAGNGKEVRQKYLEDNKKRISEYNKDYQKRLRKFRKDNWLCAVCGNKRTPAETKLVCEICRARARRHLRSHRSRKRGGN